MRVLTVNAGSTSLKLHLVDGGERIASFSALTEAADAEVDAVAHRVVHGGSRRGAVVVDDAVLAELTGLVDRAPLHQPKALDALADAKALFPFVGHVACFDTAFHSTLPREASTYALPAALRRKVRVYGFHGLSFAWSADWMRRRVPHARRVIIAHLGGGQSLCGVRDGRSRVTTMGFTPVGGLVMATRCGTLDPGAVLWLQRHVEADLADLLTHRSGLLGLAGTADMREVLARESAGDKDARLALAVYLQRFVREFGGCVAALGGIDALAFTGGIGQNSAELRARIAERLAWLGVAVVDEAHDGEITAPGAGVRSFVVEAREDLQLARETEALLAG